MMFPLHPLTCVGSLFAFFSGFPPQSSLSHIKIGDKVRVKPTVTTPKYKWGSVTHRSVGVVKGKALSVAFQFSLFSNLNSIYKLNKCLS